MRFPARCLSAVALVAALAACSGGSSPDRAATKTRAEPTGPSTTEWRPAGGGEGTCPLTLPNRSVPADVDEWTAEDSYGDGKLWTQLWPYNVVIASSGFVREDGSIGMKWPWWRGARGELTIEGRRLDGEAEPLGAEIPEGYGPSGFQPTGILFPSEGCWEVTGTVGDASLTFVTLVVKASTYSLRGP